MAPYPKAQESAEPSSGLMAQMHHPSSISKNMGHDLGVALQFLVCSVAFLTAATVIFSRLCVIPLLCLGSTIFASYIHRKNLPDFMTKTRKIKEPNIVGYFHASCGDKSAVYLWHKNL